MNRLFLLVLAAGSAVIFGGCGGAAENSTLDNAVVAEKIEKAVAAAPTVNSLTALETKAYEAWKAKDEKFWEGFLTDNFVGYSDGKRTNKAETIKIVTGNDCEFESFSFSDQKMTPVGNDAVVLTFKSNTVGTCNGQKFPSPTRASSLYVRNGDTWKAAYHNEVAIVDPKTVAKTPRNTQK